MCLCRGNPCGCPPKVLNEREELENDECVGANPCGCPPKMLNEEKEMCLCGTMNLSRMTATPLPLLRNFKVEWNHNCAGDGFIAFLFGG
jgi:hypothetical protein